ncbi:InlB B-repeat-containing protein [Intestinimonas massiliensis (ex Afouda et al. 2020)]|uniref:InlB B-repeat-containing protein n=1 Tax=Intestinimonas massiliensis (ex Afouda et al. 2020) TaxID=1673721 RepID=UPI00067F6419|nr:InlB B-repeat-containing protein [Intestinimonas massiliensis (ex Afouda et al. 2020)]
MKKRILALALCLGLLAGMVPAYAFEPGLEPDVSTLALMLEEDAVEAVELPENEKTVLTADPADAETYQWQIRVMESPELWVDIFGQTEAECNLSYPMVVNLLDENGQAYVRCRSVIGGETILSEPVVVTVTEPTVIELPEEPVVAIVTEPAVVELPEEPVEEPEAPAPTEEPEAPAPTEEPEAPAATEEPETPAPTEEPEAPAPTEEPEAPAATEEPEAPAPTEEPAAEGEDASGEEAGAVDYSTPVVHGYSLKRMLLANETPTPATYNVVIHYVFENGEMVADPYTASLAAGSSFSATVTFPVVQGYLPYVGEAAETSSSIELNYTNIQEDHTITVVYKPTNVDYTVIHYQQNVDNDQYTEVGRETRQGLTNSNVPEVAKTYEGFYALLYEKPAIAADGSTVVEVYYDRIYSLMLFDLDGGYGVEPIYARYGTPIGNVGTPTKAGYTFKGWSEDGTTVVDLPDEMPAANKTYKALWQPDNTAKVTIVFWGENADDEEYSYLDSAEVNVKPGTEFTYSEDGFLICGQKEHTHDDTCYTCGQSSHTHSTDCYAGVGDRAITGSTGKPKNPAEGQVYEGKFDTYIYIKGTWYYYTGSTASGSIAPTICGKTEGTHTHTDACLGCGKTEHTHTSSCYMGSAGLDPKLWTFVRSDTVTVAADGSSVVNVYYDRTTFTLTFRASNNTVATITDKWGADIHTMFPIVGTNGTTYKGTEWKVPDGCQTFKPGTNVLSIDTMPSENITFTRNNTDDSATLYYYVESLDGTGAHEHGGKKYDLYKTVYLPNSGRLTESEEFHEIIGFTKGDYYPNTIFNKVSKEMYLYYTRNSFDIVFYNPTELIHTEENIPYQKNLSSYAYVPTDDQVPAKYEPGSVTFAGWYLNPECSGEEFVFSAHTMPAGPNNVNGEVALSLYAKWVPVTHTVEFYLDKAALEAGTKLDTHPDQTVSHGSLVDPAPEAPANGSYTFVGWFYLDNGVEKAFDFANMPVNKDLKVYGKWSSNTLMEYTISYKLQGTDTEIAAPTTGSGLAGVTKTFEAKGGADLYDGYQEGYFPVVKSHSLTIDIDDPTKNIFTFEYIQKDAVPYTVRYLNKETGEPVADTKTVDNNRKAVVTETFVPVSGMMPDAYQKRLVVSAEEGAVNEIIFYYTKDTTHAYYKITHYTQNTDGATWTEYASSQAVGDIGTTYTADPLTIPGFTYDSAVPGAVASGELTAGGLELKLYYIRNEYPYQVRYLEQGTGKPLAEPKNGKGRYGAVISEAAISIEDYDLVTSTPQTLNIRIEESQTEAKLNVITFYYQEKTVAIHYQVVGPEGCGTVVPASETVKVLSGTANGSTAAASSEEYRFVGWYSDAACTNRVSADSKYVPEKVDGKNVAATYYAKFEPNQGSLTIEKTVVGGVEQDFIFDVTGGGKTYTVVISCDADGKGSTTIQGLTAGSYTVAERTGWSWKYECEGDASKDVTVPGGGAGTVSFTNEKTSNWFGASDKADNVFHVVTTNQAQDIQPAALPEKKLELNGEEV